MTRPRRDIVALTYPIIQDSKKKKFKMKNTVNSGQCDTAANDL